MLFLLVCQRSVTMVVGLRNLLVIAIILLPLFFTDYIWSVRTTTFDLFLKIKHILGGIFGEDVDLRYRLSVFFLLFVATLVCLQSSDGLVQQCFWMQGS